MQYTMSNILVRTISGAVFITIILVPLFLENKWIAIGVLGTFMVLAFVEFAKLFDHSETVRINWKLNTFFSLLFTGMLGGLLLDRFSGIGWALLLPILFIWMLTELWRKQTQPLANIGISLLGICYIGFPFLIALLIHANDYAAFPKLAGMFVLIWTNDTFAYLSGRFFGKTKLFERISPKKTWEGTLGGIFFTVLMAAALSWLFDPEALIFWVGSVLFIAPAAILGDLLESLFKRSLNLKDSGNIMPGHGGILDRFDATLFSLPFFFLWLAIYTYFWQNF